MCDTCLNRLSQGRCVFFYVLALHYFCGEVTDSMAHWKKYLIGEWNWMRPIKSIAFIYLALLIVALCFADRIIFQPPTPGYAENIKGVHTTEKSDGLRVGMFHLPAAEGMPTLLWSHGNAEDIGYLKPRFESFHARGYGILAYDYPGYGISEGEPDEQGCYSACQAAWDHLTQKLSVPKNQIIIYGQSVGSGPSVWLASREKTAGLVLVAPFISAFRSVTRIPLFPKDPFNNISRIESIKTPLLIVHGDQDEVIGQWNGKRLHELHSGPKRFLDINGAGHNDIYQLAGDQILDALDAFQKEHVRSQP